MNGLVGPKPSRKGMVGTAMKRMIVIVSFIAVLGCATAQNKPSEPPQPVAAIDASQKETDETVLKAFWILIDIGSDIAVWRLIH